MKTEADTLKTEEIDGSLYLDLGPGELARLSARLLAATHGGHLVCREGAYLYFNGAANESLYRDMYNRTVGVL